MPTTEPNEIVLELPGEVFFRLRRVAEAESDEEALEAARFSRQDLDDAREDLPPEEFSRLSALVSGREERLGQEKHLIDLIEAVEMGYERKRAAAEQIAQDAMYAFETRSPLARRLYIHAQAMLDSLSNPFMTTFFIHTFMSIPYPDVLEKIGETLDRDYERLQSISKRLRKAANTDVSREAPLVTVVPHQSFDFSDEELSELIEIDIGVPEGRRVQRMEQQIPGVYGVTNWRSVDVFTTLSGTKALSRLTREVHRWAMDRIKGANRPLMIQVFSAEGTLFARYEWDSRDEGRVMVEFDEEVVEERPEVQGWYEAEPDTRRGEEDHN